MKVGTIDLIGEAGGRISSNFFCRQMNSQANSAIKTASAFHKQATQKLHLVFHSYDTRNMVDENETALHEFSRLEVSLKKPVVLGSRAAGTCGIRFFFQIGRILCAM